MRHAMIRLVLMFSLILGTAAAAYAVHDTGNNLITFVAVTDPDADGSGETRIVDGKIDSAPGNGIDDGTDLWDGQFEFSGLAPRTMYTIAVAGRFDNPLPITGIFTFVTDSYGEARIRFFSFFGLARLGVVEVRKGGDQGAAVVLRASRAAGQIVTVPFRSRSW